MTALGAPATGQRRRTGCTRRVCAGRTLPVCLLATALTGCGAFQKATASIPSIPAAPGVPSTSAAIATAPHGDGLLLKLAPVCVRVKEGLQSADYNNLAAGPLGIPIFPLGILDPRTRHAPDFWLDIEVEARTDGVRFDPAELRVSFDGAALQAPASARLRDGTDVGTPEAGPGPVLPPYRVAFQAVFRKPAPEVSPRYLYLRGLSVAGRPLRVPVLTLTRDTRYRWVFSGQVVDGSTIGQVADPLCPGAT